MHKNQLTAILSCTTEDQIAEKLVEMGWEPPKVEPWEPEMINGSMDAPVQILKADAFDDVQRYMKLLAYVIEHAPEHDFRGPGYAVYKCGGVDWDWVTVNKTDEQDLGSLTMPKEVAQQMIDDLNSGRLVL